MTIHCQLLFSTICYSIVFVCKLIEIGTIAYAKSSEKQSSGKECHLFEKPGNDPSPLPCTITIYISGGTSVYALIMAVYHGCGTVAAYKENHIGRSMWVMPWLLLNSFFVIATFVCACVYSVGLYISCSNTPAVLPSTGSCSMKTLSYRVMFTAEEKTSPFSAVEETAGCFCSCASGAKLLSSQQGSNKLDLDSAAGTDASLG